MRGNGPRGPLPELRRGARRPAAQASGEASEIPGIDATGLQTRWLQNNGLTMIERCASAGQAGWLSLRQALWPHCRRKGIAASLVGAVCHWARSAGCSELASDALLENEMSHAVHRALGFQETERVVFFRKPL
jgi:GNAT superfamily N-acetyltransferase